MLSTQSEGTPLSHAEPAHHLVRLLGWCGHAVRNSIQPPLPNRPGEFHPEPLTDPDLNLSIHPREGCRLPAEPSGSSRFDPVGPCSTAMTCPLCSTGITPLHHYYGAVRPSPAHRYFRPHGWSRLCLSLSIAGQVLTFHTRARLSFAPPTCRMPLGQSQCIPQADPGRRVNPRFWHRLIRFRHFIDGSLALASLNRACRDHVPTFPQRSRPSLLTTAACGGLRSAPDCRTRRAFLHLSYSYAAPCGPALLVTQGHNRTSGHGLDLAFASLANDGRGRYCPLALWSNALSTASVIAVTPVWMVGFGTGAKSGEWLPGSGV